MVEGSRSIERRGYRARIKTKNLPVSLPRPLALDARIAWKFELQRRGGKRGGKRERKKSGGRWENVRWRNTGCKEGGSLEGK